MTETNGYGIKTSRLSPSFIGQPAPASDRAAILAERTKAEALQVMDKLKLQRKKGGVLRG